MKRRSLLGLPALALLAAPARAEMPSAEQAMVDRLIDFVAAQGDAIFIRNGKAYSGVDAATFMRKKLEAMGADVMSAEEFIAQIASRSSMSGEPYRIRFADGRELPSAQVLRAELKRLRAR